MVWCRPADVVYPSVWHRFKGRRPLADGTIPSFRVQDLPEEMRDEAVDFMCAHFLLDEPTCKGTGIAKEPNSVEDIRNLWYHSLEAKLTLVCLRENPSNPEEVYPDIVGLNMTTIARKEDKDNSTEMKGTIYPIVIGAIQFCANLVDVFEEFGVNEYMTAYGLSVKKDYRGQNIGAEILKARIPLCKAVGIKVTATIFTAIESQVLARKVNFKEVIGVSYHDLKEKFGFDLGHIETRDMINMALTIN
ncbi:uncharacterized protein LOC143909783 [Arctopsyche grandis]|uniref:uncharacterized protein LOC143909783 n=1 Tax=Arctopsyche grandis TaxID=121162 RepID=UPI00406D8B57